MRAVAFAVALLFFAACASAGSNFKEDRLSQLQPGMTEQQVTSLLESKPVSRAYTADGTYVAVWQYVRVVYVATTDNKMISLLFDKSGKYVRPVQTSNLVP